MNLFTFSLIKDLGSFSSLLTTVEPKPNNSGYGVNTGCLYIIKHYEFGVVNVIKRSGCYLLIVSKTMDFHLTTTLLIFLHFHLNWNLTPWLTFDLLKTLPSLFFGSNRTFLTLIFMFILSTTVTSESSFTRCSINFDSLSPKNSITLSFKSY